MLRAPAHAPPCAAPPSAQTLVHCSVEPIADADLTFPVVFNGANYQVYVRKRPYLDRFLSWVAARFEVVIFTASQQVRARARARARAWARAWAWVRACVCARPHRPTAPLLPPTLRCMPSASWPSWTPTAG